MKTGCKNLVFPVNDSFLASKDSENEMKYTAGKKNLYTSRGEDKENNSDFLYLSLCVMCIRFTGLSILIGLQTYCSSVHTGSIKKSCCYFFPYYTEIGVLQEQ